MTNVRRNDNYEGGGMVQLENREKEEKQFNLQLSRRRCKREQIKKRGSERYVGRIIKCLNINGMK